MGVASLNSWIRLIRAITFYSTITWLTFHHSISLSEHPCDQKSMGGCVRAPVGGCIKVDSTTAKCTCKAPEWKINGKNCDPGELHIRFYHKTIGPSNFTLKIAIFDSLFPHFPLDLYSFPMNTWGQNDFYRNKKKSQKVRGVILNSDIQNCFNTNFDVTKYLQLSFLINY